MEKRITRSCGIWLKAVISVTILCSGIVWPGGNPPVAEDTQPANVTAGAEAQAGTSKAPDIFFPETKHSFGKVFVGEKVEAAFKVVNKGNAVLDITEVNTGCDCTAIKLENWHLAPGEEEVIKVTFAPTEDTRVAKTVKLVYVNSNDPDTPRFKLKFTANVRRDVAYTPQSFELGFIPKGSAGTERLVFKSKLTPADFKITKVTTFSPTVAVSHGKLNDKGEWFVEASIKEDAAIGKLAGDITVSTNSEKQPEIKVHAFAEVVQEVSPIPNKICFGKIVNGKEPVRSITILHAKGIKVEKVEPSLSWITANITPAADNTNETSTEVEIKLSSTNAPKGRSTGVLSIYTNSKEFPVVKVHLCGNVLEPQI